MNVTTEDASLMFMKWGQKIPEMPVQRKIYAPALGCLTPASCYLFRVLNLGVLLPWLDIPTVA